MAETKRTSQALYRKYRPEEWGQVFGQDHITDVLESSIANNKVSHAYLFVGSRGTGKTSVARIFARETGVSANDTYEIDAASNRGIEDIKTLRDGVNVLPFDSKYKVYIIDEVHMLSRDAWGALLKTLEEPPGHAIFILATTEFHKVPETIISRCQVFTFKKASDNHLKNLLVAIAGDEGYKLDKDAAELLVILADGSYRDGIGELQKVLNHTSKGKGKGQNIKAVQVTREDIERITGAPKTTLVNEVLSAIAGENIEGGISAVKKAVEENLDMKLFFKLIITRLRMAIILRYAPKLEAGMAGDISEGDLKFLKDLVKNDKKGILRSGALETLLEGYSNMDNAFISELPLELALVKILSEK